MRAIGVVPDAGIRRGRRRSAAARRCGRRGPRGCRPAGAAGASVPMWTWGTSSSPSIDSITAPVAPVRRRPRSAITRITVARVEPRGGHRLLHLDHRLEQLGVEPHGLLGQLALGDVELGAEVADLAARLVAQRLPGAGGPALLAGAVTTTRYSWSRSEPPWASRSHSASERGPVVGMDVLEELLVAEVLLGVAGEPLEGRVHEGELEVHVVGDDAFAHRRGDGPEMAARLGGRRARARRRFPSCTTERHQRARAGPATPAAPRRWPASRAGCRRSDQRAWCPRRRHPRRRGSAPRTWRTFRSRALEREGFLQELDAGLEHPVAGDGAVAGARHVEHLDRRPVDRQPRRQLAAAHPGAGPRR